MKQWIIGRSMNIIKENYPGYEQNKLDRIRYGIESTYLTFTKIFVIILSSVILGIFMETCLLLFCYNLLRWTGFGIHATKSWICWVSSITVFIIIPLICKWCIIPDYLLIGGSILSILCFCCYAPADTVKRPLLNKKKRLFYRISTVITGIMYFLLISFIDHSLIQNTLFFAMVIESITIHPITYKVFHLPYQNYSRYVYPSD